MLEVFNAKDPKNAFAVPDGCIMLGYRGSIAHNMFLGNEEDPNSLDDIDLMGIIVGKKENYFGLQEWGSRGTQEIKQGKYDVVFYELRKMVQLLLQGNPNVIGMLWLEPKHYQVLTPSGKMLIKNRDLFAGKHVYNAFAGYAHHQLTKMESRDPAELRMYLALTYEAKHRKIHPNHKGEHIDYPTHVDHNEGEIKNAKAMGDEVLLTKLRSYMKKGENLGYLGDKRKGLILEHGYDAKNAAHCVRLLRMAGEYLSTGELKIFRDKDAEELLDIKKGKWSLEKIKAHADELFEAMELARDKSPLPAEPNRKAAENLLISIIEQELK